MSPDAVRSDRAEEAEKRLRLRATRRAKYLETNPRKMIDQDRYWSSLVLRKVFDKVEVLRLDDPATAWDRIRWVPRTVERVAVGEGLEAFRSESEKAVFRVRTLILAGETAGLAGRHGPAGDAFGEARRHLTGEPVPPRIVAEYHQRLGAYALREGRIDEARDLVAHARDLFEVDRPEALLLAGAAEGEAGLPHLVRALGAIRERSALNRRLAAQARALLVRDLYPVARSQNVRLCSAVVEASASDPDRYLDTYSAGFLAWIEALAAWGSSLTRWAESHLSRAFRRLLRKNDPRAAIWAGLDLAQLRALEGRSADASAALKRSRDQALDLVDDRRLIEAFDTAESLDPHALDAARNLLVRRLPLPDLSAYPLGAITAAETYGVPETKKRNGDLL